MTNPDELERLVRDAIDQLMLDAVRPGAAVVGAVYVLLAPIYASYPPPDYAEFLVGAALITGIALVLLGWRWRSHPPAPRYAQRLGALVLGSVLLNNALFLALFPEPRFAGTLGAVLLGAGWFFLTLPWFVMFIVATFAALAMVVVIGGAEADWFGPLMLLVATGGLAAVLHVGRVRSIWRLESLKNERDKAEETSQRLATAVQQSLDGIAIFDTRGQLSFCNTSWAVMHGYENEGSSDLQGASWWTFLAESSGSSPIQHKDGATESEHRHRDGSNFPVWVTVAKLTDDDGRPLGVVANARNLAERREAESRFRRAQKLESLGIMAAGIAHDFNNLLAVMIGHASLLHMEQAPGSEQAQQLDHIIDAGGRAERLTAQLSAYSGRGWRPSRSDDVDLSAQARETAQLLRGTLMADGTTVCFELAEELPAVKADSAQLQQVIMNLILNASQAIDGNRGEICIQTGIETLTEAEVTRLDPAADRAAGDYVYLEVRDDGCGMEPEVLERIFDPFFTTKEHGRGLGLAAALGIVRSHEGGLRVVSEPGVGSSFCLYLPACGISETSQPQPAMELGDRRDFGGETALVIDDDDNVRRVAALGLRKLGFSVVEAAGGAQGVDLFRNGQSAYSLCVLDLTMPGMSGEETLTELRRLSSSLPVMLTSGYTEDSVARLLEPKRTVFLKKPFGIAALKDKLGELLDER